MESLLLSVCWREGAVVMLDQRKLPGEEVYNEYRSAEDVGEAIVSMVVRGAPAIGCAAAYGLALAAHEAAGSGAQAVVSAVDEAAKALATTRPTAVNLFWALDRVTRLVASNQDLKGEELAKLVLAEADKIRSEDAEANLAIGRHGAALFPHKSNVLTHCNTGALATGGHGTALGVIREVVAQGKRVRVFADETRPLLQGARLTAWEMARDGIDVTLIPDSAAATLMRARKIDIAIVGADRIVANGDVANKIGTYSVAINCRHHGVPFYVAAPTSTIDLSTDTGESIPIEERPAEEVTHIGGAIFAPPNVRVINPAFDVTPHEFVAAIITEKGVARPPYEESLPQLMS